MQRKSRFKTILFDMDGLLADTEGLYHKAQEEIATRHGVKLKKETLAKMMGRTPLESLAIFKNDHNLNVPAESLLMERNLLMRGYLAEELKPMQGVPSVLDEFQREFRLCVATGNSREFADLILNSLNIRRYFEGVQTSDGIEKGKPHPEIYIRAAELMKSPCNESVVIEDATNGCIAGKEAGCYVIAIPTIHTERQNFDAADFRCADLYQALAHLTGN